MAYATMTSKGQITVPKEVREDMNLRAGSRVMFVKLHNGQYRIVPQTGSVDDFIGLLHDPTRPPMTIEEMNEAIADGWAESGMKGMR